MKVLCPACERMVDLERFRLDAQALVVTCIKCGVETRVEPAGVRASPPRADAKTSSPRISLVSEGASNVVTLRTSATDAAARAAASAADPWAVPEGVCPKCLSLRLPTEVSCKQCGLDFARADPSMFAPPAWLDEAWRALLLDWSNETAHASLRAQASQKNALAELGRLYRLRLTWFKDDPWAEVGREEILRMATAAVASRPAKATHDDAPRDSRVKLVLVAVLLLGLLGVAGGLIRLVMQAPTQ